uniref:TNFR-Cys domain-containing protein n=1 Tax=Electrophorus electricus TaxID=8005 RepID=A0A4W4DQ42_ELEEL
FIIFNMLTLENFTVSLNFVMCACVCDRAEYEINGECCPRCAPGNRVSQHCTMDTSTTCISCLASTYIDKPSGLSKCLTCTICDAGQGLRTKAACTQFSDTLCEPLEGHYCIGKNKWSYTKALGHSKCNAGQFIKQRGTPSSDTVYDDCKGETYSNGSLCLPYTSCEALGLEEIKARTPSSDSQCGKSPAGHLAAIVADTVVGISVVTILIIFVAVYIYKLQQRPRSNMGKMVYHNCWFVCFFDI